MKCKYWNNPDKCQYCNADADDRLQWRSCHRVVTYALYRSAMILVMLVSLWVGGVLGYQYHSYITTQTEVRIYETRTTTQP